MNTSHNAPVGTSSNPQQQNEEMLSSTEKKLDQVIELLKQLNMQGDQKKRIPWE